MELSKRSGTERLLGARRASDGGGEEATVAALESAAAVTAAAAAAAEAAADAEVCGVSRFSHLEKSMDPHFMVSILHSGQIDRSLICMICTI